MPLEPNERKFGALFCVCLIGLSVSRIPHMRSAGYRSRTYINELNKHVSPPCTARTELAGSRQSFCRKKMESNHLPFAPKANALPDELFFRVRSNSTSQTFRIVKDRVVAFPVSTALAHRSLLAPRNSILHAVCSRMQEKNHIFSCNLSHRLIPDSRLLIRPT